MARPNYGPGEHCAFNDFPQGVFLVIGEQLAANSNLFEEGKTVVLQQTPLSGTEQGDKVVGEELPKKAIIYTDTSDDDLFDLKVEYYGWGEFYLQNSSDDTYTLDITEGIAILAGDWDRRLFFEEVYTGRTKIPESAKLNALFGTNVAVTVDHAAGDDPVTKSECAYTKYRKTDWRDYTVPQGDVTNIVVVDSDGNITTLE